MIYAMMVMDIVGSVRMKLVVPLVSNEVGSTLELTFDSSNFAEPVGYLQDMTGKMLEVLSVDRKLRKITVRS